jgi:putative ABC transport system ATP-binding protein
VLVTHEAQIAAYADREVTLRDGVVDATGLGLGVAS